MITAEDLMKGCWVMNTHNGKPERVYETRERMVMLDYNDLYDYDEIKPIPLTVPFLEGNGFSKFDFLPYIEGQHQWTWWADTMSSVSLWTRELRDDTKDGWMIRIEAPLVTCCLKVEYVHQLQHILRTCGIKKEIIFKEG